MIFYLEFSHVFPLRRFRASFGTSDVKISGFGRKIENPIIVLVIPVLRGVVRGQRLQNKSENIGNSEGSDR